MEEKKTFLVSQASLQGRFSIFLFSFSCEISNHSQKNILFLKQNHPK